MKRYSGFTCPKCGSHMFGSFVWFDAMKKNPKFSELDSKVGDLVGHCNGLSHYEPKAVEINCQFVWNRETTLAESEVMYEPTQEERLASLQSNGSL